MRLDKSMIEAAYEVLEANNGSLSFKELSQKVGEMLEMSEEELKSRLGALYTSLSFDGRFVTLTDNTWDLRTRHTYAKVHIDVNDAYSEVEETEEDPEENEDNDELGEGEESEEGDEEEGEKKMSEEEIESLGITK